MKRILTLGLAVAGFAWALTRRGEAQQDAWAQATDQV